MRRILPCLTASIAIGATLSAQTPTSAEFDVVSIKRVTEVRNSMSFGDRPDGSWIGTNMTVRGFVLQASPVRTREVVGLPEWALSERYDVTLKGRPGLTDEQQRAMWRAMFEDRMKLAAHIEQRERDVYRLVVARADGRLGPQLKPSALDCTPRPTPPPNSGGPARVEDFKTRCGYSMNGAAMFSGGISMERLARALDGIIDADVEDQTGLSGYYALTMTYSSRLNDAGARAGATPADDAPDVFTAVQEQLGLRLVREKKLRPVFVVDHIERPTEN